VAVIRVPILPSAHDIEDDRRLSELRKGAGVTAILHSGYPVRHRDKDLGPDQPHLFALGLGPSDIAPSGTAEPFDLTPRPGDALRESDYDLSSDGQFVVASWQVHGAGVTRRSALMRIDLATGARSVIVDDSNADLHSPAISPDCSTVAYIRESHATASGATRITLGLLSFEEGPMDIASGWDRWPKSLTWVCDGSALIVTADDNGRCPMWRIDVGTGGVTQVTFDDFAYSDVVAVPDGAIYALRSSFTTPPHPVRVETDGAVAVIPCVNPPVLSGSLTELAARTRDGVRVRAWLVLPDNEKPAPLLLWIHGGPRDSWNRWSWEWNPWLLSARGYAVVLPDPALSTGYGQDFIQRGWGSWGPATFDDLMAITEVAVADPRIDATRTAAMGGSFGGFMANWVAGHTDRFAAIVSHASLWALDQFRPTTDTASHWRREITPEFALENSPHRFVGRINTPMLIIHGDKDYLVPINEAMRLWFELLTDSALPAMEDGTSPHRFLYFPTESHWVRAPQHVKVWYQVVIAFLAEHVLGEIGELPETLG
jgi:dipeptidyl aminopeptidase/acylaminoacyl peptidase